MTDTAATTGGLKAPSTAKEALAALIAGAIVLGAANLAANGLKGLLEESVRSSVVGMMFAAVPAVYGFSNRALNGFQPKRLEMPDLLPWYVTGLFAGACLFAWIQFVGVACGFAIGLAQATRGLQLDMATLSMIVGMLIMPLLAPAAFLAGVMMNRSTRGGVFLAVILAALLCAALSFFMSWTLTPEAFNTLVVEQIGKNPAAAVGIVIPSVIALIFGLLGVGWSAFRHERSLGRVAHAARRLKPAQRDEILTQITSTLERAA
jgi:hypothetical protein